MQTGFAVQFHVRVSGMWIYSTELGVYILLLARSVLTSFHGAVNLINNSNPVGHERIVSKKHQRNAEETKQ